MKESEKEELCGEKRSDDGAHTVRHGGMLRDIMEGEGGRKGDGKRPRLEYFHLIIGDMDVSHLERSKS